MGVQVTQVSMVPQLDPYGPLADMVAATQELARRVGATEVWSHHVAAVALSRKAVPGEVYIALGVPVWTLRAALRRAIAERYPGERADVWHVVLDPTRRSRAQTYADHVLVVDSLGSQGQLGLAVLLNPRSAVTVPQIVESLPFVALGTADGSRSFQAAVVEPTSGGRVAVLGLVGHVEVETPALVIEAGPLPVRGEVQVIVNDPDRGTTPLAAVVIEATDTEARVRLSEGFGSTVVPLGAPVLSGGLLVGLVEASSADLLIVVPAAAVVAALDRLDPPYSPQASEDGGLGDVAATNAGPSIGSLEERGDDAVGDIDQLSFEPYVRAFADLIASPHTKPPLTIGIFGSWGSGKSFLLEHIEREIARRPTRTPRRTARTRRAFQRVGVLGDGGRMAGARA